MTSRAVLGTQGLRMVVEWRGDRFRHFIITREQNNCRSKLESIEGTTMDLWPTSPALQSIHMPHDSNWRTAMLVGMAGRSHWSMCIEADFDNDRFHFDAACRLQEPPNWIGSTYQRLPNIASSVPTGEIAVRGTQRAVNQAAVIYDKDCAIFRVSPQSAVNSYLGTARWPYAIEFVSNSKSLPH